MQAAANKATTEFSTIYTKDAKTAKRRQKTISASFASLVLKAPAIGIA